MHFLICFYISAALRDRDASEISVDATGHIHLKRSFRNASSTVSSAINRSSTCEVTLAEKDQKRDSGKRVAIILRGLTFKNSGRGHESATCSDASFETQKKLADAHNALFSEMENWGYAVSIFGVTYACSNGRNFTSDLPTMYGNKLHLKIVENNGMMMSPLSEGVQGVMEQATREATPGSSGSLLQAVDEVANGGDFDVVLIFRWDAAYHGLKECHLKATASADMNLGDYTHWSNRDNLFIIKGTQIKCFSEFLRTKPDECCGKVSCGGCHECVQRFHSWLGRDDLDGKPINGVSKDLHILPSGCPPATQIRVEKIAPSLETSAFSSKQELCFFDKVPRSGVRVSPAFFPYLNYVLYSGDEETYRSLLSTNEECHESRTLLHSVPGAVAGNTKQEEATFSVQVTRSADGGMLAQVEIDLLQGTEWNDPDGKIAAHQSFECKQSSSFCCKRVNAEHLGELLRAIFKKEYRVLDGQKESIETTDRMQVTFERNTSSKGTLIHIQLHVLPASPASLKETGVRNSRGRDSRAGPAAIGLRSSIGIKANGAVEAGSPGTNGQITFAL